MVRIYQMRISSEKRLSDLFSNELVAKCPVRCRMWRFERIIPTPSKADLLAFDVFLFISISITMTMKMYKRSTKFCAGHFPSCLNIPTFAFLPDVRQLFGKNLSNENFKRNSSSRLFSNKVVAKCPELFYLS